MTSSALGMTSPFIFILPLASLGRTNNKSLLIRSEMIMTPSLRAEPKSDGVSLLLTNRWFVPEVRFIPATRKQMQADEIIFNERFLLPVRPPF